MLAPLILALASIISADAAPSGHPWVDKQEAKQRYPVTPDPKSPTRGATDGALVTVNEFVDFECPYCKQEEPDVQKLLAAYPTQIKFVFKNLPLKIHPKAQHKAIVAECIGEQGKFWQAHDKMLADAPESAWSAGVDQATLKACVARGGDGQVARDLAEAKRLGLATTPSFVIDGMRQGGVIKYEQLKNLVDAEIAKKGGAAGK